MSNLNQLETILDYKFNNPELLRDALTHRSFLNEHPDSRRICNERLEFLGDAVLELAVSEYIYKHYPTLEEGKMSQLRAVIVCEKGLYAFANDIGLGEFVFMSHGEEIYGGRKKPSILSDAVEAIFAAVYLDSDFIRAKNFIIKHLEKFIVSAVENDKSNTDYKSRLQELALSKAHTIEYIPIGENGPDHDKVFIVEAVYNKNTKAAGQGKSKKKAQQNAAKALLDALKNK